MDNTVEDYVNQGINELFNTKNNNESFIHPGILSDRDIIRLCDTETNPMITPFNHKLSETGVISYGLSSYGYDATLSKDFKIFYNDHYGLMDPKNLDTSRFRNHTGDTCIIPPNGFVLGCTNEYFIIPDDVISVCLGKSTYARCFSGDTKIALVDKPPITFLDMISRSEAGEEFLGYGVDKNGKVVITELVAPRKIGHEKLIEICLDNNEKIKVTPDHIFLNSNGVEIPAGNLSPGDSLFSLYRSEVYGHGCLIEERIQMGVKNNHRVVSISEVERTHDVYCLTSLDTGNFALESEVFVNNCGIHVIVTPLEPGWQGQVVIEIINSTSIPAKIYADEGICQFLFFKGATPCITPYNSRGGKYMNQTGVTLPKIL